MYEQLFLTGISMPHAESCEKLEQSLLKLYEKILYFLSRAIQTSAKGIFKRTLQALTSKDIESYIVESKDLESEIHSVATLSEWFRNRDVNETTRTACEQILKIVQNISVSEHYDYVDSEIRGQILTRLSPVAYEEDHYFTKRDRVSGSGKWILEHETFRRWYDRPQSDLLWLQGISKYVFN